MRKLAMVFIIALIVLGIFFIWTVALTIRQCPKCLLGLPPAELTFQGWPVNDYYFGESLDFTLSVKNNMAVPLDSVSVLVEAQPAAGFRIQEASVSKTELLFGTLQPEEIKEKELSIAFWCAEQKKFKEITFTVKAGNKTLAEEKKKLAICFYG